MNPLLRFASGLASVPVGLVAGQLHRWMSGPQAVLDVTIERREDLQQRQLFLHHLRRAADDESVAAVLLRLHEPVGGWAATEDLRRTIQKIRASGRAVYASLEAPGNALVWLASACDRVFLVPTGEVALVGVGVELTFFGSALARLGVVPDFEAAGAYKSFGEPWTRSFASPANQEAVADLVQDLHRQLVEGIAEGRGRPVEAIEALLEQAPLGPKEALDAGLVDQLAYDDELEEWVQEKHGSGAKLVPFRQWVVRDALLEWVGRWGTGGSKIAVLHLDGPITMDGRAAHVIRARHVVPILRQLRKDDDVGAVVLHVNSPGGSALASDLMWREVEQLRRAKPVVAAFEDVAASGGYYLSAPAMEILARATTLTGSIGVFGGKLVAAEGLRKLGVHHQPIQAAPNANLFTPSRHFTKEQRSRFRASLQRFYDGFVQRVADGRDLDESEIEPHCRGRVWTGAAATERRLVDRHGDLDDAIERARVLAGLQHGQYVRQDLSSRKHTMLARAVSTLRRAAPVGAVASTVGMLLHRVGGARSAWLAEMLLSHEGQALAMLPFELETR